MRIAQVCPTFHPYVGGVETHVKEISERLAKRGHDIEILTTNPGARLATEETTQGFVIRRFSAWAPNESYYFSAALHSFLRRNSNCYEVVHAHNYHAFPALYAAQAKGGNKLIFTPVYHGTGHTFFRRLLHRPYKLLGRRIFQRADRIICLSEYEMNLVLFTFRLNKSKVVLIPNGVDVKEFGQLEKTYKPGSPIRILCVSRLEQYKGIQHLIEVLPKLETAASLTIVGKGPCYEQLLRRTSTLGLQGRVRFLSDLSRGQLLRLYSEASLFVLLSRHEAFGIAVAEALASRTPCIVANTSALAEWVDGTHCFAIDYPIDLDELARLIRHASGIEVRSVIPVDWNDVVEKLEVIYAE